MQIYICKYLENIWPQQQLSTAVSKSMQSIQMNKGFKSSTHAILLNFSHSISFAYTFFVFAVASKNKRLILFSFPRCGCTCTPSSCSTLDLPIHGRHIFQIQKLRFCFKRTSNMTSFKQIYLQLYQVIQYGFYLGNKINISIVISTTLTNNFMVGDNSRNVVSSLFFWMDFNPLNSGKCGIYDIVRFCKSPTIYRYDLNYNHIYKCIDVIAILFLVSMLSVLNQSTFFSVDLIQKSSTRLYYLPQLALLGVIGLTVLLNYLV